MPNERLNLFDGFSLDLARGCLVREAEPVHLRPQSFEVLKYLVENKGRLISKDKLIEQIWHGRAVTDGSLGKCIEEVREALGTDARLYIRNVRGRGYIFDPTVGVNDETLVLQKDDPISADQRELKAWSNAVKPSVEAQKLAVGDVRPHYHRRVIALGVTLCVALALVYAGYRRAWPTRSPQRGKVKLVVLPFANPSGDPEQEYFSDGMTEEMITELANLEPERLGVIARPSAMQYKHSGKGIDQIARELGVDYVLESSVLRSNGRVRINARLIQASDQTHLWAQSYERELHDVLAVQSDVARNISREIALKLSSKQQVRLESRRQINPEAHEAYLKGLFFWGKFTPSGMAKSIEYFQQAIAKDPGYAQPYARMARAYGVLGNFSNLRPEQAYPRQKEAALKALGLDDTLDEAHSALGWTKLFYDRDWPGAREEFQRAVVLSPNSATAHQSYAMYFVAMGQFDRAHAEILRAQELDPVSLNIGADVGWFLFHGRRTDESIAQLQKVLEMDQNFVIAQVFLSHAYQQKGMFDQAIVESQKAVTLSNRHPNLVALLGRSYALAGRRREARQVLSELTALSRDRYISPYDTALLYVSLGENEEALNRLEEAYRDRFWMIAFLKVDPRWDVLRSHPRFIDLLRQSGLSS